MSARRRHVSTRCCTPSRNPTSTPRAASSPQGAIEWSVRALGRAQTVEDLRRTVVVVRGDVPVLLGDVADVRRGPGGAPRRGAPPQRRSRQCARSSSSSAPTPWRSPPESARPSTTSAARCQRACSCDIVYDQSELVDVGPRAASAGRCMLGGVFVVLVLLAPARRSAGGARRDAHHPVVDRAGGSAPATARRRPEHDDARAGWPSPSVSWWMPRSSWWRTSCIAWPMPPARSGERVRVAAAGRGGPAHRVRHVHRHRRVPAAVRHVGHRRTHVSAPGRRGDRVDGRGARAGRDRWCQSPRPRCFGRSRRKGGEDVRFVRWIKRWYAPGARLVPASPADGHGRDPCAGSAEHRARRSHRQRLHAAAGRGRVPAADGPAGRGLARRGRPREPSRRGRAARQVPEVEDVVRRTGRAERTEDPMPHTMSDVLVVLKADRARTDGGNRGGHARAHRRRARRVGAVHDTAGHAHRRRARRHARGSLGADLRTRPERARAAGRPGRESHPRRCRDRRPARRATDRLAPAADRRESGRDRARRAGAGRRHSGRAGRAWWARRRRRFGSVSAASISSCACATTAATPRTPSGRCSSTRTTARQVPLGQLADISQTFGPAAIRREAGTRRIAVEASVSGRDLGSTAAEVRQTPRRRACRCRPATSSMSAAGSRARRVRRAR